MKSLKETKYYNNIVNEIDHPLGTVFVFDGFIVVEIDNSKDISYDKLEFEIKEGSAYLRDIELKNTVILSNRIHSYSLDPLGWKKYFDLGYTLKAFGAVIYTKEMETHTELEKIFLPIDIPTFNTLDDGISWAKGICFKRNFYVPDAPNNSKSSVSSSNFTAS
ncbi:MAG: hypothetical protein AAF348_08515 [Bacteroidota bacterium]